MNYRSYTIEDYRGTNIYSDHYFTIAKLRARISN